MESLTPSPAFSSVSTRRRSFGWLLAKRYLNPVRAHFSIVSLICLLGVSAGVAVLIVVLSVMAGFQDELKAKILGVAPHIQMRYQGAADEPNQWREVAKKLGESSLVSSSGAFVEDYVILMHRGNAAPGLMNGVDADDPGQSKRLAQSLMKGGQGNFDLGRDLRAVISSKIAQQFHLELGDTISLVSARNSETALHQYEITRQPMLAEAQAELFTKIQNSLKQNKREMAGDKEELPLEVLTQAYDELEVLYQTPLRPGEKEGLERILGNLGDWEAAEENSKWRQNTKGRVAEILAEFEAIKGLKRDAENLKVFENLESLVLPKELEIVGIYQASAHARTPDVFVPLEVSLELAGRTQEQVDLAVSTHDAYAVDEVMNQVLGREVTAQGVQFKNLPAGWVAHSWTEQYAEFFNIIENERSMMRLVLSLIMFLAAFCIAAVMFTITMQKKREIGVMKALGARPFQIIQVFLYQGALIGVLGAGLGIFLGWLVIINRAAIQKALASVNFDPFPSSFHGVTSIPARIEIGEIVWIAGLACVLCTLAALIPAYFSSRTDPAKSLRNS